jgi:hypothetical protein
VPENCKREPGTDRKTDAIAACKSSKEQEII